MSKIDIIASRHSAFYSPLISTISGDFLKEEGFESSYRPATPGDQSVALHISVRPQCRPRGRFLSAVRRLPWFTLHKSTSVMASSSLDASLTLTSRGTSLLARALLQMLVGSRLRCSSTPSTRWALATAI